MLSANSAAWQRNAVGLSGLLRLRGALRLRPVRSRGALRLPSAASVLGAACLLGAFASACSRPGTTAGARDASVVVAEGSIPPESSGAESGGVRAAMNQRLQPEREVLESDPGNVRAAVRFAARVQAATEMGFFVEDPAAQGPLVDEAEGHLQRAALEHPEHEVTLHALRGELLLRDGRRAEGLAALEISFAARPNILALEQLAPIYASSGKQSELAEACAALVGVLDDTVARRGAIALCLRYDRSQRDAKTPHPASEGAADNQDEPVQPTWLSDEQWNDYQAAEPVAPR